MGKPHLVGLGLAALVGCHDHQLPPVPKETTTYSEPTAAPRFLDISSFAEAEERLRQYIHLNENERAWITDGVVWKDIGGIATKHSTEIDEEAIEEALSSAISGTLYFYHQHGLMRVDGYPVSNLPSMSDLFSNIILNRTAKEYGKRIVSRVVEVYGTWEFIVEDSPTILPPNTEFLIFEAWIPTGEAVKDLPQRLQAIQLKHQRKSVEGQIPYLLRAYQQVEGISMRFMAN